MITVRSNHYIRARVPRRRLPAARPKPRLFLNPPPAVPFKKVSLLFAALAIVATLLILRFGSSLMIAPASEEERVRLVDVAPPPPPPVLPVPPKPAAPSVVTKREPSAPAPATQPATEPLLTTPSSAAPVAVPAETASAALTQTAASGGGEPLRIEGAAQLDNTEFYPIVNVQPGYPVFALKANIEGYVDVDLLVDEKGRVESFTIVEVKGHPSFGDETAKVIGKWRFPPPRLNGKRVRVKYLYRVNFTLE